MDLISNVLKNGYHLLAPGVNVSGHLPYGQCAGLGDTATGQLIPDQVPGSLTRYLFSAISAAIMAAIA